MLRDRLDAAEERLAHEGLSRTAVRDLLRKARDLQQDDSRWFPDGAHGLAVFLAPGFFLSLRVPFACPESLDVGAAFHVTPLVPLPDWEIEFFVLGLSPANTRLFRCRRREIAPAELPPRMPRRVEDALGGAEFATSLQASRAWTRSPC